MKHIAFLCLLALCFAMAIGCSPHATPSATTDENGATTPPVTESTTTESTTTSTSQSTPDQSPVPQPIPNELPVSYTGYGASSVLTLKNLRTDKAVQQFAFYEEDGVTYVFVTQRVGTDTHLSRCRVDTAGRIATATWVDSVELKGFGHGESMDVSFHNGKLYLFLGYSANPVTSNSWSREVVRVRYENGKITDQKVITGFQYTTKDGSAMFSGATPYRINFGLDDAADQISFYTRCDKNNTGKDIKQRITSYRLSALHQALDTCSGPLNMKNMSNAYLASTGSVSVTDICSNSSFQGMDVDDKGVIWLTGGVTDNKPQISHFKTSGKTITRNKVQDIAYMVSAKLGAQDFRKTTTYVEIESIKYYKGNYYCAFNPAGDLEMNFTEVYLLKTR